MSDNQTTQIRCKDCNQLLDETYTADNKKPCPNCGSILRLIEHGITLDIPMPHIQLRGKVRNQGKKKPSVEFRQGDDLHCKTGKWNKISRRINREQDLYKEEITDPETGQIIHKCEEPLSKHQGHGSAKPKKQNKT